MHPDAFFSGATKSGTFPSLMDSSCRWWSMIVAGPHNVWERDNEVQVRGGYVIVTDCTSEVMRGYIRDETRRGFVELESGTWHHGRQYGDMGLTGRRAAQGSRNFEKCCDGEEGLVEDLVRVVNDDVVGCVRVESVRIIRHIMMLGMLMC